MTEPIIETFEEINDSQELATVPAQSIANPDNYFCSKPVQTFEDALDLAEALSNSDALDDMIGETVHLHDYVLQAVQLADKATGEVRNATRIVLMCDEGNYGCASKGIETALRNLVTAMKNFPAPWNPPIAIKFIKEQGASGFKYTTFKYVR